MKATITYEGVRIETDATPLELQELIFALKAGEKPAKPKRGRPRETVDVAALNDSQQQTWQYLTAHDTEEGVHVKSYVDDANITYPVAENRLKKLVDLGLARKVGPARYRAGAVDA